MEEIAEFFLRIITEIIRFVFCELLDIVLFNLGRFTLLIITYGRYPKGYALEKDKGKISFVGLIAIILLWTVIALYNNYG